MGCAPLLFGCVEPWSKGLLHAAMLSLAAFYLRPPIRWGTALAALTLGIAVVLLLGTVHSLRPSSPLGPRPLGPWTASRSLTASELMAWAGRAAVVWAAAQAIRGGAQLKRLCWTVFLAGTVVALIGLGQRGGGRRLIYGFRPVDFVHGYFGPYFNYDHAANLMMLAFVTGAGLLLADLSASRHGATAAETLEGSVFHALKLAFLGVLAWGILATGSRGALQGACVGTGLLLTAWAFNLRSSRGRLAALAVLAGAATLYCYWLFGHRELLGLKGASFDGPTLVRLSLYRSSLEIIADHPLFGIGLGAVRAVFPLYQGTVTHLLVDHVHNDWLELGLELGVPAVAFLAACLGVFAFSVAARLGEQERRTRVMAWGCAAAAAAFAAHGMVDFNWHVGANAAVFCALLGGLAGLTARSREVSPIAVRAGIPVCVALAALCLRPVAADALQARARSWTGHESGARLDAALSWDAAPSRAFRAAAAHANASEPDWGGTLARTDEALRRWPAERDLNRAQARALSALGRTEDARYFESRAWGTR